jgi:hypothetical protein
MDFMGLLGGKALFISYGDEMDALTAKNTGNMVNNKYPMSIM